MMDWALSIDKLIEEETSELEEVLCGLNESEMELIGAPVEKKRRGRPRIHESTVSRQMKYLRNSRGKLNEATKRLEKFRGFKNP